ncbi:MAG: carbohydrate kinase [Leptospiraceae bacterium]|nr:MAG: carbohydrate kinase [Leptospiraceae bacterium]
MNPYVLSIDCGTQSIRAIIFDASGNIIEKTQLSLEYESPYPGWAEQKPEYFWQKLIEVINELWKKQSQLKSAIVGITLTTQRGTVINIDKNGNSLRPAITWFDQRQVEDPEPIPFWNIIFKILGMSEAIDFFQRQIEASWIYKNEPEIWKNTYKYLLLSGYLSYKLTGNFIDSIACQVGYIPFDYKRHQWASKWDWKWKLVPASKDILPDLVQPGKLLGTLSKDAAKELDLKEGIPVIAAGSDKACETLGCGVIDDSSVHLSFGTTATVNVVTKKYKEAIPFIPPYPSVIPGHYTMEIQIFRGFWLVSWFKEQFAFSEKLEAEKRSCSVEEVLEKKIKDIPPGCLGLILQPYWSPGIRIPGPEARGAIIGFSDWHTKYHLYRAILEGIGFSLREGTERIEKKLKKKIPRIAVGGGGSNSEVALQITADIFNRNVEKPFISEASALGAAMIAFYGLGIYKTIPEAVRNMYKVGKIIHPDKKNHKIYDYIYKNAYLKIYQNLKPIYKVLKEIV